MACAAAIFQVVAQVYFGSLLSDIAIANHYRLILIHYCVCLSSVCLIAKVNILYGIILVNETGTISIPGLNSVRKV